MPMYAYRRGRKVVTRQFPVAERPKFIVVGGKRFFRSYSDERPGVPGTAGWPIECYASGVNPDQAGELRKFYADRGCPTEVTEDGNPVYRDARHRKKALKLRGFRDNSSFF